MQQSGGGIDVHRCTDDDQYVGLLHIIHRYFNGRYCFAEPHDEGAQLGAILGQVAYLHFPLLRLQFLDEVRIVRLAARCHLHQFAMQVDDV